MKRHLRYLAMTTITLFLATEIRAQEIRWWLANTGSGRTTVITNSVGWK